MGGAPITTHYDERKLSAAAMDTIRRGSVGAVTVKGATGGIDRGVASEIGGYKLPRFSVAAQGGLGPDGEVHPTKDETSV